MRRVIGIVVLALALTLPISSVKAGTFDVRTKNKYTLRVWCRHDAVYWGSVVGEVYKVRMMLGWYEQKGGMKGWHVQPQVFLNNEWHYFKCVERWDKDERMYVLDIVFISMPKERGDTWKAHYPLTWAQFAVMHNSWIMVDNVKSFNENKGWNVEMNRMIDKLRYLEREYTK